MRVAIISSQAHGGNGRGRPLTMAPMFDDPDVIGSSCSAAWRVSEFMA